MDEVVITPRERLKMSWEVDETPRRYVAPTALRELGRHIVYLLDEMQEEGWNVGVVDTGMQEGLPNLKFKVEILDAQN